MTLIQGMVRMLYTERKVDHFENDVEEWLEHHEPILDSLAWQDLIRDANKLFEDIQRLDHDLRLLHANGLPFHEELDDRIPAMVRRWQKICSLFLPKLQRLASLGATFQGYGDLQTAFECATIQYGTSTEESVPILKIHR